ncbi:hypothetical protein CBL_05433 [Carabus blaptoides fortunei]
MKVPDSLLAFCLLQQPVQNESVANSRHRHAVRFHAHAADGKVTDDRKDRITLNLISPWALHVPDLQYLRMMFRAIEYSQACFNARSPATFIIHGQAMPTPPQHDGTYANYTCRTSFTYPLLPALVPESVGEWLEPKLCIKANQEFDRFETYKLV